MNLSLYLEATRPKTLIVSICPVLLGTALALKEGFFEPLTLLFLLLTGLGVQITTNLANDWLDFVKGADRKERKGPRRLTQSGLVSAEKMKRLSMITASFTLLCGIYLIWQGGFVIAFLLALALLLAFAYTGGPFPLAYLGLGELFVLLTFGPIATAATHYLYAHHLSSPAVLLGFCLGSLACGPLIMNNLRDKEEDRISRKKTLIVRFGSRFGKMEYTLLLTAAIFAPLIYLKGHPLLLSLPLTLVPAYPLLRSLWRAKQAEEYIPFLAQSAQLMALYTFILACAWML